MGGWGRQNPWPIQWGGGDSEYERLWKALRAMLGTNGAGPIGGLEDAWRESEVAGMVAVTTMFERACVQALPAWATDHLPVYERLLELDASGELATRRAAAAVAWTTEDTSTSPALTAALQEIDPGIAIVALDPDQTSDWQLGKAFGNCIHGMVADISSDWPNFSQHHVLYLLWSGCPGGIPSNAALALVTKLLKQVLPSWCDYSISTVSGLYCDGFNDSHLDLSALST